MLGQPQVARSASGSPPAPCLATSWSPESQGAPEAPRLPSLRHHRSLAVAFGLWLGPAPGGAASMGKHFLFTSGSLWGESQGQQPARKPAGAWRWGQGEGGSAGWPGQQGANRGSRGLSLLQ